MNINIKLDKNFTMQFNKLYNEFGTELAKLNGFADEQMWELKTFAPLKVKCLNLTVNFLHSTKFIMSLIKSMVSKLPTHGFAMNGMVIFICMMLHRHL